MAFIFLKKNNRTGFIFWKVAFIKLKSLHKHFMANRGDFHEGITMSICLTFDRKLDMRVRILWSSFLCCCFDTPMGSHPCQCVLFYNFSLDQYNLVELCIATTFSRSNASPLFYFQELGRVACSYGFLMTHSQQVLSPPLGIDSGSIPCFLAFSCGS